LAAASNPCRKPNEPEPQDQPAGDHQPRHWPARLDADAGAGLAGGHRHRAHGPRRDPPLRRRPRRRRPGYGRPGAGLAAADAGHARPGGGLHVPGRHRLAGGHGLMSIYSLARPFLFGLDAERAHGLGLKALDLAYSTGATAALASRCPPLPTRVLGLTFPNPVGLAAGLDKNGAHIDALLSLGFGFVEVGTVTPRPQPGNPKPRMFRLPAAQAVINRLGFNNDGVDALVRNVERARRKGGLLGINIGKNK